MKLSYDELGSHVLAAGFDGDGHTDLMNIDTHGKDTYIMLAHVHAPAGPGRKRAE